MDLWDPVVDRWQLMPSHWGPNPRALQMEGWDSQGASQGGLGRGAEEVGIPEQIVFERQGEEPEESAEVEEP